MHVLAGIAGVACDSLDCGLYFERQKVHRELASALAMLHNGSVFLSTHVPSSG